MTLRTRLALTLGLLAAASAAAVALIGYRVTDNRVADQLDTTLMDYAHRLADPDGRLARTVCTGARDAGDNDGDEPELETELPGAVIQCLDSGGKPTASYGELLPIEPVDASLASGSSGVGATRLRSTKLKGAGEDLELRVITVSVATGGAVQVGRDLSENEQVLSSLRIRLGLLVAAVAAAAAIAGWLIARRTARPVVGLTDVAEQIAASGRLDLDVPVSSTQDETGRLSRAFATMLDALRQSRVQQQRLVQDAGHELRTPLTSLRANVHSLRRHPELDEQEREAILGELDSELRELTVLSNDLVAMATEPDDDESPQHLDLAELCGRATERARRRFKRPINARLEPTALVGRPRELLRAVTNLLDNAAKFSPPGTSIDVTLADRVLTVRDHGPGIAAEDLPHVFERFYRATSSRTLPGSGLGLSIVEETAKHHHATLTAANAGDGGAVFRLSFPTETASSNGDGDGDIDSE